MSLTSLELLHTRAVDGLASAAELAELMAAGVDVAAWAQSRTVLREALDGGEPPELADEVLAALDGVLGLTEQRVATAAALDAGEPPDVSAAVLAELGLADAQDDALHDALVEALHAGAAPDLSADILAAIGQDVAPGQGALAEALDGGTPPELWASIAAAIEADAQTTDLLSEALQEEAGGIDIIDAVMRDLGLELDDAPDVAPAAAVVPLFGRRAVAMGGLLAAAAALLLAVFPSPTEVESMTSTDLIFAEVMEIQDNNQIEIEDLESSPDTLVQIFQTEDGAPTIIFIDELEPEGEGVPL